MTNEEPNKKSGFGELLTTGLILTPLLISGDFDKIAVGLDMVVNAWKVLSFLLVLFMLFRDIKAFKFDGAFTSFLALLFILAITTALNGGVFREYLVSWLDFLAVFLFVRIKIGSNTNNILQTKNVLVLLYSINFLTIVLFPNGLWSTGTGTWLHEGFWLFGHRNSMTFATIATIAICSISDKLLELRVSPTSAFVYFAGIATAVLTWSATNVVLSVICVACSLLVSFGKNPPLIPSVKSFVTYIILDIAVVIFQIQTIFASFFELVLNRNASLSNRTALWDIVLSKIAESPVIGYGVTTANQNGLTTYNPGYIHTHNGVLETIYIGGILALVLFLLLLYCTFRSIEENANKQIRFMLLVGLLSMMVNGIVEPFYSAYFYMFLAVCIYFGSSEKSVKIDG